MKNIYGEKINNPTIRLHYWTLNLRIPIISINLGFDIRKDARISVLLMLDGLAILFLAVL